MATFYEKRLKVGSNGIKILGNQHPKHRRNKQQSATAKYANEQPSAHQVRGHHLHLRLHQGAIQIKKTKEDVESALIESALRENSKKLIIFFNCIYFIYIRLDTINIRLFSGDYINPIKEKSYSSRSERRTMKPYLAYAIVIICMQNVQAQEIAFQPSLRDQLLYGSVELPLDSLPQTPKRKLIPANASFMEKYLWDEDGLFRKMGLASPLTSEVRKNELSLRRGMLTAHLIGGIVTLGSMYTAIYYGQQMLNGHTERSYRNNHQLFVITTIISYSATGLLSVLSPPPMIRRNEVSTITIHKALAWVHFTGMVLTPLLGTLIKRRATTSQLAHFHQASAYITAAALTASMIVITF
jgi:hypothetical protein